MRLVVLRQVLTSSSEIEMWGDGKQTRSFTFIDDCVEGILRVTKSDIKEVGMLATTPRAGVCISTWPPAWLALQSHGSCL